MDTPINLGIKVYSVNNAYGCPCGKVFPSHVQARDCRARDFFVAMLRTRDRTLNLPLPLPLGTERKTKRAIFRLAAR